MHSSGLNVLCVLMTCYTRLIHGTSRVNLQASKPAYIRKPEPVWWRKNYFAPAPNTLSEKNDTCLGPCRVGLGLCLKSGFMPTLWSVSHKPRVFFLLHDLLTLARRWDEGSSLFTQEVLHISVVPSSAVCLSHLSVLPFSSWPQCCLLFFLLRALTLPRASTSTPMILPAAMSQRPSIQG